MKIKLIPNKKTASQPMQFPVIMEFVKKGSEYTEGLVLFTNLSSGMVLQGMTHGFTGKSEAGWINCNDESMWRKYEGVIELSN